MLINMLESVIGFFQHADTGLVLSGIVALGIAAQWLAWYLKQPSIIFLLALGLIIGPLPAYLGFGGLQGLDPDALLGNILFPFISLGVAIILFEGSLTLQFHELKSHGTVVQNLVSVGVLITILITTLVTYFLFDMSIEIALLFGALVCVTGPTVILPILRSVRPNQTITNVLKWEGIIIDPIGAIAVVLIYEFISTGGSAEGNPFMLFAKMLLVAFVLGMIGAASLAYLIKRHKVPEYLQNVFTLAFVLLLFSVSNQLEHESGLLTVTIMGVALANWPKFPKDELLHFNESLSVLLISVLFIVLAARVEIESLLAVGIPGLLVLATVMFVARPAAVFASSYGSKLTFNEKLMISWIGPRGIVAAAISSLFAIRLQDPKFADMGLQGAELLVPLVFVIILGTVVIQSIGAKFIANFLGLREPAANGVLIVGSNPVALAVAKALKAQSIEVIMAHNNYSNISKARMEGIRHYLGNPVSEHAERQMDLVGIGHVFAMSVDQELNALSEVHFRHDFGEENVHRLRYAQEKPQADRDKNQQNFQSNWLFSNDATYAKLASMISKQARAKVTKITENYTYSQYRADNTNFVPLFYLDSKNRVHVVKAADNANIPEDSKLVSLVVEEASSENKPMTRSEKTKAKRLKGEGSEVSRKLKSIDTNNPGGSGLPGPVPPNPEASSDSPVESAAKPEQAKPADSAAKPKTQDEASQSKKPPASVSAFQKDP